MKKKIIYLTGIILWWFIGGALSLKVVAAFNDLGIFSSKYLLENGAIVYSLIVSAPFMLSNSIAALLVGIIISLLQAQSNRWRFGIVLMIFGSVPFTFLSSYKDYIAILVSKLLISSLLVLIFSYFGNLVGNYFNKFLKGIPGREDDQLKHNNS